MTDLEFTQRCARGDRHAWEEFIGRYSRLIYNYIYSVFRTHGHNPSYKDSVNDVFQEIFLLLAKDDYKKLKTYQGKNNCSLASWLRQVAIHASIDYLRRQRPDSTSDQDASADTNPDDVLVDGSLSIRDALADEDTTRQLTECIDALEIDEQFFLELHINRALAPVVLAKVFGISRPAVDMRKRRIIAKLRECFKLKGFVLDM